MQKHPFNRSLTILLGMGLIGAVGTGCDSDSDDADVSSADAGHGGHGGAPNIGGTPGIGGAPGNGGTPGTGGGPGIGGRPSEAFEATDADFADYASWFLVDYTAGPVNAILGTAHMGPDLSYSRLVWSNVDPALQTPEGEWPLGTRLVKETFTWVDGEKQLAAMGGVLAMAKRGGGFNPEGAGWEWFELRPDATIAMRGGAEMMMGMCNGCHAAANGDVGHDRSFKKPSDLLVEADDFADYASWTRIGTAQGPNPFLGPAHHGDDPDAQRVTYRSPALGRPDEAAHGYPIGTRLVKAVIKDGAPVEVTAMVKRGWDFAPEQESWEWFILDPATGAVADRGPNLMDGMCTRCHELAEDPANGVDYVFKHSDDAFNK